MERKSPTLYLVSLGLFAISFVVSNVLVYDDYRLSTQGISSTAIVERLAYRHRSKQGRETYYHEIIVDGRATTLGLDVGYPNGRQLIVTYLPKDPSVIKVGDLTKKSSMDVISEGMAPIGYLISLVMLIITIANYLSYKNNEEA